MGPESTGKSTLCKLLAEHYQTFCCPEYARKYLLANGTNYTYHDLLTIAKGQINLEDEYLSKVGSRSSVVHSPSSIDHRQTSLMSIVNSPLSKVNGEWSTADDKEGIRRTIDDGQDASRRHLLFVDTDMYVMKVWCEYVFNRCHQFILDKIVERKCDLYLLCDIDLPWIKDELREYPDLKSRKELYEIYKDILSNQTVPWTTVSGNYEDRLNTAVKAIDALLTS